MDFETEKKIQDFADHLSRLAVDIEADRPETAKRLNAA